MDTSDYVSLLDYMSASSIKWFAPGEAWECDEPDEPDWPAPTNQPEIVDLLRRLPSHASVIGSLTAAAMVLPLWENYTETHSPAVPLQIRHLPRFAIQTGNGFLENMYTWEEVEEQVEQLEEGIVYRSEQLPNIWDIVPYGSVGYWSSYAARINNTPHMSGFTVHAAARAYANSLAHEHMAEAQRKTDEWEALRESRLDWPMPTTSQLSRRLESERNLAYRKDYDTFLPRWWQIVRCRLAFRIDENNFDFN